MRLEKVLEQKYGGWTVLVHELTECIQNMLENANYTIEDDKYKLRVEIDQIKEKYGGLRFYYHLTVDEEMPEKDRPKYNKIDKWGSYMDQISGAVWFAERMSYHICEGCGNPGKLRDTAWRKTRCDKCQEEYERRFVNAKS